MRPDEFNYDRYLRACEDMDARAEGFHRGEFLPVMQWSLGPNTYSFDCRDPKRMLENQLDGITQTLAASNDQPPHLEPWHGIGVFAEAYGCPFEWGETDAPWTRTVVDDIEGLKRLEPPQIEQSALLRRVLETTEYFNEQTKGRVRIAPTDTQSPLSTMSLICDVTWMLTEAADYPEELHRVLDGLTGLIIAFSRRQRALCTLPASPGHTMWSPSLMHGISLSADMLALVGRDFYEEFGRPYDERIARELGGVGMHSCGRWHHNFEMVKSYENLSMIDLAISTAWDPGPAIPEKVAEAFGGTGIPVQARCDIADLAAIDMLIRADCRMIFSVFWDDSPAVRNRNYDLIKERFAAWKSGR